MKAGAGSELGSGRTCKVAEEFRSSWWLLKRRGLVAALGGGSVFLYPGEAPAAAVALLVIYSAMDSVLVTSAAARTAQWKGNWRWLAAEAVAGFSALLVSSVSYEVRLSVLMWILAVWATATAACTLAAASHFRDCLTREWLLAAGGVVMMRFGALVTGAACYGAAGVAIWASGNSLAFALLLAALGSRLHTASFRRVSAGFVQSRSPR